MLRVSAGKQIVICCAKKKEQERGVSARLDYVLSQFSMALREKRGKSEAPELTAE